MTLDGWGCAHISKKPFYKGAHLVCRTRQKGIRSNTFNFISRDEWEVKEEKYPDIMIGGIFAEQL